MKIYIKDTTATKRAIYESGINFEQFADKVGMNVSYLSQVLNKRVSISIKMARRIAEALDAEIRDVFTFEAEGEQNGD